ncbi:MAG: CopG family transcriptional regulator [bacterium]
MKRTTIFADEEILENIKQIAREREISLAEAIRQALEKFVLQQQDVKKQLSFLGIGRSGRKDIAERHETLLWKAPRDKKAKA